MTPVTLRDSDDSVATSQLFFRSNSDDSIWLYVTLSDSKWLHATLVTQSQLFPPCNHKYTFGMF